MAAVRDFSPMLDGTRGSDINNNSPFMSQGAAVGVEATAEAPFSQISTALIPTCRVAVSGAIGFRTLSLNSDIVL